MTAGVSAIPTWPDGFAHTARGWCATPSSPLPMTAHKQKKMHPQADSKKAAEAKSKRNLAQRFCGIRLLRSFAHTSSDKNKQPPLGMHTQMRGGRGGSTASVPVSDSTLVMSRYVRVPCRKTNRDKRNPVQMSCGLSLLRSYAHTLS